MEAIHGDGRVEESVAQGADSREDADYLLAAINRRLTALEEEWRELAEIRASLQVRMRQASLPEAAIACRYGG